MGFSLWGDGVRGRVVTIQNIGPHQLMQGLGSIKFTFLYHLNPLREHVPLSRADSVLNDGSTRKGHLKALIQESH